MHNIETPYDTTALGNWNLLTVELKQQFHQRWKKKKEYERWCIG